jgi:hypothetical protein
MKDKIIDVIIFIFWLLTVIVYPMLISIYVTLPLFIGFAGLMLVLGIEKDRYWQIALVIIYMINLEINLSLPLLLIPISVVLFMFLVKPRLSFLKMCPVCIRIVTVIMINVIYFILLYGIDFATNQNSVRYDSFLLFSLVYDIIAAVLI